jgi:hypothetical protein
MRFLLMIVLLIACLSANSAETAWVSGQWVMNQQNQYVWVPGHYAEVQPAPQPQQVTVVYVQSQPQVIYVQQPVVYRPVISTFAPPVYYGGFYGNSCYNGYHNHSGISVHGTFVFRR